MDSLSKKMRDLLNGKRIVAGDEEMRFFENNLPENKVNRLASLINVKGYGLRDRYIAWLK